MTTIDASIDRRVRVDADRATIWPLVSHGERLAALIPDVEHTEPVGEGWRWRLRSRTALGQRIEPEFVVILVEHPPDRVEIRHDTAARDPADVDGEITLGDDGEGGTVVRLALHLRLDLPIPRLARGAARSLLQRELDQLGDGFAAELERSTDAR